MAYAAVRTAIREALTWGPQTMPGLYAAIDFAPSSIMSAVTTMAQAGELGRLLAVSQQGPCRVYWLKRGGDR